jgi:hypothetical protein
VVAAPPLEELALNPHEDIDRLFVFLDAFTM